MPEVSSSEPPHNLHYGHFNLLTSPVDLYVPWTTLKELADIPETSADFILLKVIANSLTFNPYHYD